MSESNRWRDQVFANVARFGWHYYRIYSGPNPPWSYTIGLYKTARAAELVFAGAATVTHQEVAEAFAILVERAQVDAPALGDRWRVPVIGEVTFGEVHDSWKNELLLGDVDFYDGSSFPALQVIASDMHTIDTPDMTRPVADASPGPWQWLQQPWPYELPESTQVFTDTLALRGEPVTMVVRNLEMVRAEWNAWATHETDVPAEIIRLAAFGTLLAADETLAEMLRLDPGQYGARDNIGDAWRVYNPDAAP
jgi:hypothetical protein